MPPVPKELVSLQGTNGVDILFADQAAANALNTQTTAFGNSVLAFNGADVIVRDRTGGYSAYGGDYSNVEINGGGGVDTVAYMNLVTGIDLHLGLQQAQQINGGYAVPYGADHLYSIENAVGTVYDDSLIGSSGANILTALGGNDEMNGGAGSDTLHGGDGMDDILGGSDHDTIDGGNHDDDADGGSGNDTIYGGGGDDYLRGGTGNDVIHDGDGNDELFGDNNNDKLYLSDGDNDAYGGSGNDKFYVDGFADNYLDGGSGTDMLYYDQAGGVTVNLDAGFGLRSDGTDTLVSVEGVTTGNSWDVIFGSSANNSLLSGGGNDVVAGFAGDDHLSLGSGNDAGAGGEGEDRVYGDQGDDTLWGGEDDDLIRGGNDDDVIIGGEGDDDLRGDSGVDTFMWNEGEDGYDTVRDFNVNVDKLAFGEDFFFSGFDGTFDFEDVLQVWNIGNDAALVAHTSSDEWQAVAYFENVDALVLDQRIANGSIFDYELTDMGDGMPEGLGVAQPDTDFGVVMGYIL